MALLGWMRKKDGAENEIEVSLSEEDKKRMDAASKVADELPEIKKRLDKMDSISSFIDEFKADREKEKTKKQQDQNNKTKEEQDQELEELFLTDPKRASEITIQRSLQGTNNTLLQLRADSIKREVFEDANKFKFYHGDIKTEVDKLIAGQTIAARNDPSVVENCYLTVIGRHNDEILEGKIKSRFAAGESGSRGTASGSAGDSGAAADDARAIAGMQNDPEVIRAAKQVGIPVADYAKMLHEDGVEYV
jgi:hypothetical protein